MNSFIFYGFILFCLLGIIIALVITCIDWTAIRRLEKIPPALRVVTRDRYRREPPVFLSQEKWAEFEGSIENLKRVIVVADKVERPNNSLERSVINNFGHKVHYSFIVSKSKASAELHGYYEIFKALAVIAIHQFKLDCTVDDLVSILALPDEWDCVPLVFYRVGETSEATHRPGSLRTIAFWGNNMRSGISESYESLPPEVADALAIALVSGAPEPIKEMLNEVEKDHFLPVGPMIESMATRIQFN